jgi:uncharacterized membrane protein YedE/YeeE
MDVLRKPTWSPYAAGALAGLLLVLSVFLTGKYFGASTTFVRAAGFVEQAVAPEKVAGMAYFLKEKIKVDWQFLFVVGVLFGSLASSSLSGERRAVAVPPMWEARFGASRLRRWLLAFIGGMVAMFGARLADGCPSGHGLSGLSQVAVSGYISLICFFLAGAVMARILYGGGNGHE